MKGINDKYLHELLKLGYEAEGAVTAFREKLGRYLNFREYVRKEKQRESSRRSQQKRRKKLKELVSQ